MVHPADYFWGHVAGRATGLFGIALLSLARHPEVGDPEVPVLLEDEVFGLEVAVDDPLGVDELEAEDDAAGDEFCVRGEVLVCSSLKNS